MIKHILPNPFLRDYKCANLEVVSTGDQLLLTPLDPVKAFWICFAIDKGFNPVNSDDLRGFELLLEGDFVKGTRIKIDTQDEVVLDATGTEYRFPLIFTEPTLIKNVAVSGTFKEPIVIRRLTMQPADYTRPQTRKNVHFIYAPSNVTGVFRKYEKDILDYINVTDDITHDCVVCVRPTAELVTGERVREIAATLDRIRAEGKNPRINNDISYFYNHNIKNFTFDIWEKNKLPITEYSVVESLDDVHSFIAEYKHCVFRINNQWGGRHHHVFNTETPAAAIEEKYNKVLEFRNEQLDAGFEHVDMIINRKVLPVRYSTDLILNVGRSYVVNNRILNTHAFVHKMSGNNQLTGSVSSCGDFVTAHEIVLDIERRYGDDIVRCVTSLGIQTGSVDILIEDGKPLFLEVNAWWGAGLGTVDYPYSIALREYLLGNRSTLYNVIPNAYDRMDPYYMWKSFYREL